MEKNQNSNNLANSAQNILPPEEIDYINMLVYGPFGVGKTVFAATAQLHDATANVLYISAEGGDKSIRDFGIKVDIFRINTFKQFNRVYEFLRNHAKLRDMYLLAAPDSTEQQNIKENLLKLKAWLRQISVEEVLRLNPNEPVLYRTAVVDSITEVQKYAMYHILGVDLNTVSLDNEIAIPQLQHWGKSSEMIRMLIRMFRDLKMHTIFCALDQTVKDEKDGSVSILPSLPGKLAQEICGFLDIVAYMLVKPVAAQNGAAPGVQRYMQVQPSGKINAKSRYRALGTYIQDPTVGKIVELISKGPVATVK